MGHARFEREFDAKIEWLKNHPWEKLVLDGPEFLHLVLAQQEIAEAQLCKKLDKDSRYLQYTQYHHMRTPTLSYPLAASLAQLSAEPAYCQPEFWQAASYTIAYDPNRLFPFRLENGPLPTFRLHKRKLDHIAPKTVNHETVQHYKAACKALEEGQEVDLAPQQFLKLVLDKQALPAKSFAEKAGLRPSEISSLLAWTTRDLPLPEALCVKLAGLCTEHPYNEPNFWQKTSYHVRPDERLPAFSPNAIEGPYILNTADVQHARVKTPSIFHR